MTDLDTSVPHIVTAPHSVPFSALVVAFCTCGEEFTGTTAEEVREASQPHRDVEKERLGSYDRDRDENRRLRQAQRREQRRNKSTARTK